MVHTNAVKVTFLWGGVVATLKRPIWVLYSISEVIISGLQLLVMFHNKI